MKIEVGREYTAVNDALDPELVWSFKIIAAVPYRKGLRYVGLKRGQCGSLGLCMFTERGREVGSVIDRPFRLVREA